MSAKIPPRPLQNSFAPPVEVTGLIRDAWKSVTPRARHAIGDHESAPIKEFRASLGKLPFKYRRDIAAAWASTRLGGSESGDIWKYVATNSMEPILVFILLRDQFADALAPVKELTLPANDQIAHFERIRKHASALADALDGSIYDQGPAFLMTEIEVSKVVDVIKRQFLHDQREKLTTEQMMARSFLTGIRSFESDDTHLSEKHCFANVLEPLETDATLIKGSLSIDEELPSLSILLRRLADRAPRNSERSEFGKNPRTGGSARRAFTKMLREVGREKSCWGRPHLKLIALAVTLFFDQTIEESDLFK
jgi:hypothetical protein